MYVLPSLYFLSSYFPQFRGAPYRLNLDKFRDKAQFYVTSSLSTHNYCFIYLFFPHCFSQLNIEPNHTTLAGHSYEHDVVMASKYVIFFWFPPWLFLLCHLLQPRPCTYITSKFMNRHAYLLQVLK